MNKGGKWRGSPDDMRIKRKRRKYGTCQSGEVITKTDEWRCIDCGAGLPYSKGRPNKTRRCEKCDTSRDAMIIETDPTIAGGF